MNNIISDEPIRAVDEDFLNREPFSKNLSDSIIEWSGEKSLVIGLYGKWGTGKTSVINITEEIIKQAPKKQQPIIVHFSPWEYSETDDLVEPFVFTLKLVFYCRVI